VYGRLRAVWKGDDYSIYGSTVNIEPVIRVVAVVEGDVNTAFITEIKDQIVTVPRAVLRSEKIYKVGTEYSTSVFEYKFPN
jgi:hypothetical protein